MEMKYLYPRELKLQFLGEGEWLDEPDEIKFKYKSYECWVRRFFEKEPYTEKLHYSGGYLCGYVAIPSDHPSYQKRYEDIDIAVHGGLTFGMCSERHWIGFDCAHAGDLLPSMEQLMKTLPSMIELKKKNEELKKEFKLENHYLFNSSYKNTEFCILECHSMVDQLIDIKNNQGNNNESPNT